MTTPQTIAVSACLGALAATNLMNRRTLKAHQILVKQHRELEARHEQLRVNTNTLAYMLQYVARRLDESGIELDDFDRIALDHTEVYFEETTDGQVTE